MFDVLYTDRVEYDYEEIQISPCPKRLAYRTIFINTNKNYFEDRKGLIRFPKTFFKVVQGTISTHHCENKHSRLCASNTTHQRFGFMTYKTKCIEMRFCFLAEKPQDL